MPKSNNTSTGKSKFFTPEDVEIRGNLKEDGQISTLNVLILSEKLREYISKNGFLKRRYLAYVMRKLKKIGVYKKIGKIDVKSHTCTFIFLHDSFTSTKKKVSKNSKTLEILHRYPLGELNGYMFKDTGNLLKNKGIGFSSQVKLIEFSKNNHIDYIYGTPVSALKRFHRSMYERWKRDKKIFLDAAYTYFHKNTGYIIQIPKK